MSVLGGLGREIRGRELVSVLGLVFCLFLVSVGCGPDPLTKQQLQGLALYKQRCAHCHEDNDLALKKVPPDLHGLFDRKTLPSGIPATDEAVRDNVLKGRGMMPGFAGRFDQDQMAALLAYLHTGMR